MDKQEVTRELLNLSMNNSEFSANKLGVLILKIKTNEPGLFQEFIESGLITDNNKFNHYIYLVHSQKHLCGTTLLNRTVLKHRQKYP